ncbi:hypothetical protein B296_00010646 [Ensete ventricosum]|uniref:Uncharacterized protein n=1 Tax=Ensete ventricosum TaxID=4639 RepID=A0A426ZBA1_ENSVE|nr:hypothetical protein B296_00010646 [Ensete ventricosum]
MVSGVFQDGAKEFASRRTRLTGRLSRVAKKLAGRQTMTEAMELQPDNGPRSSLGIRLGSDNVVGSHRSSLGDSLKGSGSSLGTCREITEKRPEDSSQECRRLLDLRELGLSLACWSLSVVIIES